jgi:hypothetical protein
MWPQESRYPPPPISMVFLGSADFDGFSGFHRFRTNRRCRIQIKLASSVRWGESPYPLKWWKEWTSAASLFCQCWWTVVWKSPYPLKWWKEWTSLTNLFCQVFGNHHTLLDDGRSGLPDQRSFAMVIDLSSPPRGNHWVGLWTQQRSSRSSFK